MKKPGRNRGQYNASVTSEVANQYLHIRKPGSKRVNPNQAPKTNRNGLDLLIEAVKIMEKKESKVEKTQEETPQRTIPKVTKRPEEEKKEINDVILQTMIFYNDGYNEILIKVHHSFHFK